MFLNFHVKICTDHHCSMAATDLEHHFILPIEIALMTQGPDIVIWSMKFKKKVFVIELTVPLEETLG